MRNRVITAIAILVVLLPIIYVSPFLFKIMATVLIGVITHEFLEVKKEKKYSIVSQIVIYLITILPLWLINDFSAVSGMGMAVALIIFYSLMVFDKRINFEDLSYILAFSVFLIVASNSAMFLRNLENGFFIIVFIILVTAASDTGAFFTGTLVGKHKLIERISPKKTVEGLIGGIIASVLIGVAYYYIFPLKIDNVGFVIIISAVLGLFACLGDLFFSAIKRTYQIKDFSNILPGHGGFMDRVDSHLTNFIVFFIFFIIVRS